MTGADFPAVLSRKPWFVLGVAGSLGRAHAAMHERNAPGSLPELNHELARRIESARALPGHDPACLENWMFGRAAARFNQKIEAEYRRLTRLLEEPAR